MGRNPMSKSVKDMLAEANAAVPKMPADEALERIRAGDAMVVVLRDGNEVQQTGKIKGALNVSQGHVGVPCRSRKCISQHSIQEGHDHPYARQQSPCVIFETVR